MTQSVTFHFSSPHFTFTSGLVAFTKGARLFSDGEFHTGRITNGVTENVLVEGPIEFDALLGDLTLIRNADGHRQRVAFARLTGQLREEDIRTGRIPVAVEASVLIVVRVVDTAERPLANVTVSFHSSDSEATFDTTTNERGEIVILGNVGRYDAMIGFVEGRRLWPPVENHLDITTTDVGERVLLLRLPA